MEFEINRDVLLEGLGKVAKVVPTKSSIPILNNILFVVKEDEISLTASDSEETIMHSIPVDGEEVKVMSTGKVVLPKHVIDIAKKTKNVISFSNKDFSTTIKSGKSEFQLNGIDPEEYPKFSNQIKMDKATIVLDGDLFSSFVKRTVIAASTSDTRPILKGVLYEVQGDCINLVCTDSHRLAKVSHKAKESNEEARIVIPAKSLENAIKIFDFDKEVQIFTNGENNVIFRNGQTTYLSRLLDGNYPETKRLIPTEFKSVMKINRKELLDGLELISGIANSAEDGKKGTVNLHVNGLASLSSHQAQTGKGKVEIFYESLEGEVDDYTISFSAAYAIDSLKTMDCQFIDFNFSDPMRPFLLTPCDSAGFEELQLILPVRQQ